ncbi:SRPBCC domain-containing protein [Brachybacterium sacelli]|uniref:Uncharacterized protein YndB with AHSA1/START domain n=1 Tax=Brachybacterium sacelli TaxID=173364 RepID=A0ABS4WWJ6_9MICO|nr:SRPBCC domain-containing protein [Brachybacterium sacelli]MBP2380456.1 uncharacterized protein YndB with AHSA1/START domain [Brachybacterium sacelli]
MTDDVTSLTTDDIPDEIVRSIRIDASAETVFDLISEPGWFINDGEYREHEITVDGATATVVDPVHGEFSIGTLELDRPRRAVFQWLGGEVGALEDFPSNTIEFTIEPAGDGVELTVREVGFAGISPDAVERRTRFEDNTQGWIEELGVAKTRAEAA